MYIKGSDATDGSSELLDKLVNELVDELVDIRQTAHQEQWHHGWEESCEHDGWNMPVIYRQIPVVILDNEGMGDAMPSTCMELVVAMKQQGVMIDMLRHCVLPFPGDILDHELRFDHWSGCMEMMLRIDVYSKLNRAMPQNSGLCVDMLDLATGVFMMTTMKGCLLPSLQCCLPECCTGASSGMWSMCVSIMLSLEMLTGGFSRCYALACTMTGHQEFAVMTQDSSRVVYNIVRK